MYSCKVMTMYKEYFSSMVGLGWVALRELDQWPCLNGLINIISEMGEAGQSPSLPHFGWGAMTTDSCRGKGASTLSRTNFC